MIRVTVLENREEAPEVQTLLLRKPEGFTFVAGQFVVLQAEHEGRPMRRSYSIASAPHEDTVNVTVKRQRPGRFSPVLCALSPGEEIGLLGPFGAFVLPPDDSPLVLLAAGTGITPFISFLRDLRRRGERRDITVLYSARTSAELLYRDELESLASEGALRLVLTITRPQEDTAWEGQRGRITAETLRQAELPSDAWNYICGPTPMVTAVREALLSSGVRADRVRTEKFGNIEA